MYTLSVCIQEVSGVCWLVPEVQVLNQQVTPFIDVRSLFKWFQLGVNRVVKLHVISTYGSSTSALHMPDGGIPLGLEPLGVMMCVGYKSTMSSSLIKFARVKNTKRCV